MKPLLSILICTVPTRVSKFTTLFQILEDQAKGKRVEILHFLDNFEHSVGYKRNALIETAKGEYVCFVDDDDRVAHNYVDLILEALKNKPDVVGLIGMITTNGVNPKRFEHSLAHHIYYESNNIYYRPPNHLNPIKKELIADLKFPEKYFGEDYDWCMAVQNAGVLKTESPVSETLYFYDFNTYESESLRRRHR